MVLREHLASGGGIKGLAVGRIQSLHKGDGAASHPRVCLGEDPQLRVVEGILRQALDRRGIRLVLGRRRRQVAAAKSLALAVELLRAIRGEDGVLVEQKGRRLAVVDKGNGGPDLGARACLVVGVAVLLRPDGAGAQGKGRGAEEGDDIRRGHDAGRDGGLVVMQPGQGGNKKIGQISTLV